MEQEQKTFEQYIAEQIEGYRMYPSANVWRNVNEQIGNKTKPTAYALFALAALTLFTFNFTAVKNNKNFTNAANISTAETEKSTPINNGAISNSYNINSTDEITAIEAPIVKAPALTTNNVANTNSSIKNIGKNELAITNTVANTKNKSTVVEANNESIEITEKVTVKENEAVTVTPETVTEANIIAEPTDVNTTNHEEDNKTENNILPEVNKTPSVNISEDPKVEQATALKKEKKKATLQMYVTPGISYRLLYDKRNNVSNIPFATQGNNNSVNATVFHKPALSIEAGAAWVKPINNNLEFKAGVQANYNSYKIKASYTNTQLATIALSNNNGSNYQINSVTNWSTAESAYPTWVENTNVQLSVPVGLNFLLNKSGKTKFGIGTTVQPTVKVYNKAMLLSTDLKNYTTAPYLVRNFNLNAGFEAFMAIKGKKLTYQFGPQLRYQVMSTYAKKYPFKENLFDYGFKIAVSNPF